MHDAPFKPAGAAFAAIVAGLAAPGAMVDAAMAVEDAQAGEEAARDLAEAAATFAAVEPFAPDAPLDLADNDVPLDDFEPPF